MLELLLFIIVVLALRNYYLKERINELNKTIDDFPKFCGKCGNKLQDDNESLKEEVVDEDEGKIDIRDYIKKEEDVIVETPKPVKKESQYTDTEIKNSLILISGSCLLVLAAILFLATTWTVTSNYIKTFVLILMLIIFSGASKIADKYLNIKQTAKAFYYMALAYIPIVFISIFVLKLLGDYFSYYGEGKYIYLFISSLIVSIIYYVESTKNKSKVTTIASMLMSYFSVVFWVCVFNTESLNIICALTLYTFLLTLLYYRGKYYLDEEIHRIIIVISTMMLILCNLVINTSFIHYINLIINFVNIYYLLNKALKREDIYEYIFPAYIMIFFFHLSVYFNDMLLIQVLLMISFIVVYLVNLMSNKMIKESSYFEVLIGFLFLISYSIINKYSIDLKIPVYIIMSFFTLLNYLYYIISRKYYSAWISNILFVLSIFSFFIEYSYSFSYLGLIYLVVLFFSKYVIKENNIQSTLYNISYLFFLASSALMISDLEFASIVSYVIFIVFNLIEYNDKKKDSYKIMSYVFLDLAVICSLDLYGSLNMTNASIGLSVITLLLALLENYIPELNNKMNNNYLLIHSIISFILLNNAESSLIVFATLVVLAISFVVYVLNSDLNKNLNYIPVISLMPYLYFKSIEGLSTDLLYYLSMCLVLLFTYLIYLSKDKRNIVFFFLYVICHILAYDESKYLSLALISLGTFVSYYVTNDKTKDLYKSILSVEVLVFVKFILHDLDLTDDVLCTYTPYFVWLIYVTRNILKNHMFDYKSFEYIGSVILNLIVLYSYTNESEGILFIGFLILLVFVSYILKYGPYFIVSLIFILINFFSLTSEFWLSLSWWVYALGAGLILIGFGIVNEMNENKINNKELMKSLKDKLDL